MYRLIIADDEALIRAGLFYRNNWKEMGFEVVAMLEDGTDVLKILEEQRVDVLLTDICMYQVSGLELANIIQEKYPWMKVVLLSGYREFEYAREAIRCGVYEYLLKPIDYDKLRQIFEKIKQELDAATHEEQLLHCFGEAEYDQVLALTRLVADSVLGEGEENWMAYARLKPMLRDAPTEIKEIVIKRLLELLQKKLSQKDAGLAGEFAQKLQALELSENADTNEENEMLALFSQLNDELVSRNLVSVARSGGDDCIRKACSYISNHLGEDFTYREVAEFVHLSPRHFIRRFRNEMGETFTDYVFRSRMEGAMRLLEEKKLQPEDIGQAVGYHDDKYFQQLFKKYTGCTVREYWNRKN
ncbi:MAG: response regulator [Roseburia sp.]|nr:response regulator [Roseburia sp.]